MGDGQLGLFGGEGDDHDAARRHPSEMTDEQLAARREEQRLPVEQRALGILGVAAARDELAAGRKARFNAERRCRRCGSDVVDVDPKGQHLSARCAECGTFSYNMPRYEVGLAPRPVTDVRPEISASRRAWILDRDNWRCVMCGRPAADDVQITVGHLVSVKDGQRLGAEESLVWDDLNLAAMCDTCQLGLRDVSVSAVAYLALQLVRARRARRDGLWPAEAGSAADGQVGETTKPS